MAAVKIVARKTIFLIIIQHRPFLNRLFVRKRPLLHFFWSIPGGGDNLQICHLPSSLNNMLNIVSSWPSCIADFLKGTKNLLENLIKKWNLFLFIARFTAAVSQQECKQKNHTEKSTKLFQHIVIKLLYKEIIKHLVHFYIQFSLLVLAFSSRSDGW